MHPAIISLIVSLSVAVIMFFLNKVTFKSSAELEKEIKSLKDAVEQLKREGWTTEQRVNLEARLTVFTERITRLDEEVDFTRTSHKEFLRLLERAFIPVAHSPHTPELDALLERREAGEELSSAEWQELINRLEEQSRFYNDMPGKKVALRGLLAIYLTHLRAAKRKEGLLEA